MNTNLQEVREAIARCLLLKKQGVAEAKLRSEFESRLRLMFPGTSAESWINHYMQGVEEHTTIGVRTGGTVSRFIDTLINGTTIEYESDLQVPKKREEGMKQVQEHLAGLICAGTPVSQVRGVLSDTIEWHAFDARLRPDANAKECTAEDVELVSVDFLHLKSDDEESAKRLELFLLKHLGREQSRPLTADNLTVDLGLESTACEHSRFVLTELTGRTRSNEPSVELATDLWSQFVDRLEGREEGFRTEAYVDEVYLSIMARLLSANVLREQALLSDDSELCEILDGSFFLNEYRIMNFVERDYFRWVCDPKHVAGILPIARRVQHDLYAYDFNHLAEPDVFGRLMAQLARVRDRKLLGQEWTPKWLAQQLAERCVDEIPADESPAVVDMCCGAGAVLVEVLAAAKKKHGYEDMAQLGNTVTGIDIDPLAVTLSKTAWTVELANAIRNATESIMIPIFHADSLFAITPVSAKLPKVGDEEDEGNVEIIMDGNTLDMPSGLLQAQFSALLDRLIQWVQEGIEHWKDEPVAPNDVRKVLEDALESSKATMSRKLEDETVRFLVDLAHTITDLASKDRNGIWAFILRNTYRPGLLAGTFNGLASNAPWLAMSALANNPYHGEVAERATMYGLRPTGSAFLHAEIGTLHLIHAVDRYLKTGASVACIVPGTILNGKHHEPFRQQSYLKSNRGVPLRITEVWQVAHNTFKYPGAVVIGRKEENAGQATVPVESGGIVSPSGVDPMDVFVRDLGGDRTAWALETHGEPAISIGVTRHEQQGADIMPRRAVCVDVLQTSGDEYRVDTPAVSSENAWVVQHAKELIGVSFPGFVAPCFLHTLVQSENLLPFMLLDHHAKVAIPATRSDDGQWQLWEPADMHRVGLSASAQRFSAIDQSLVDVGKGERLTERVNLRAKLAKQRFPEHGFVVISGAGGTFVCGACIPIQHVGEREIVFDQTLYWHVVEGEDEAWYLTGFINSEGITEAILPFNPSGNFGPRHVHTLPYKIIPPFEHTNAVHMQISELARKVAKEVAGMVGADSSAFHPRRSLPARRKKVRGFLREQSNFQKLNRHCGTVLALDSDSGDVGE